MCGKFLLKNIMFTRRNVYFCKIKFWRKIVLIFYEQLIVNVTVRMFLIFQRFFVFTFRTLFKKSPKINGKDIDLYLLYVVVTAHGGWIKVSHFFYQTEMFLIKCVICVEAFNHLVCLIMLR